MRLNSKEQIIKDIENQLDESIIAKIKLSEQSIFSSISDMTNYIETKGYRRVNEICGICEFMAERRFYDICKMIEDFEVMNIFNDRIDRWKCLKDEGYKKSNL